MYRKLQDPPTEMSLSLELDSRMTHKVDRWGEAGSPTEAEPHQLSFLPTSGRLLKSESEDSGVEMASNDHSPSTPVGSEKSFSLDCLDGFQPSVEDSPPPAAHQSCAEEKGQEVPSPIQERTYQRSLSISKKLAQVVQRSQKHHLPSHSPRPPTILSSTLFRLLKMVHHVAVGAAIPLLTSPLTLNSLCLAEGFSEETSEGSGMARVGPQLENPAASEMEEEKEGDTDSPATWHPQNFRPRSASDTRELRSPARNLGNKADGSRKSAAHFASSPSLLDQLDGGSRTLPAGIKIKNDHSHWSKVRVLINRIKRKSVRTNEPSSSCKPAPSSSSSRRQCGADTAFDKQESHHRRNFLPSLGAKKRHSKHLSIR
ncbi:hypothetical protein JD844_031123 [Phrynosoma platyrhinos]|uniref:DUF4657 domain-containing protein n=1 Tax=Phrynosoma platyrhinos TaxID=52577 RepID=A0ABQ7T0F6_PHRPL|nr:hypothetical protein JD844_031123 [Phrynosoma platyrhinos]